MEELEELKKELEEVLEKVNGKLEEYDEIHYWAICQPGAVLCFSKNTDPNYDFKKRIGNYFKTEEEGKEYLEDLKIKTEIKSIANELNENKKIDWNDDTQTKYFLRYEHNSLEVGYGCNRTWKTGGTIYCLDSDFMNVCIKRIGQERLENYLKRN